MAEAREASGVCVIGAGPAGMAVLYQYAQLLGQDRPRLVCYEKQSTWGGQWNYTWQTGTDEYGEPVHTSMYKHLWINSPKEGLELADYTYMAHFGRDLPSYIPRALAKDYFEGRWTNKSKEDLKQYINFNHVVRHVHYSEETDSFTVQVLDLVSKETIEDTFTHVIVASGIFSTPKKPFYPGLDIFEGRVIHSHDFREAREFRGQRVLVFGYGSSAEDIAILCFKFGAKRIVVSLRTKTKDLKWPDGVEERPCVERLSGNTVWFRDGSYVDVDTVILCTGYKYYFPFLQKSLLLDTKISFFPENLYRGMVWTKGGNKKLFYLGVQRQLLSVTMFDVQAVWLWKFILGKLEKMPKHPDDMAADMKLWCDKSLTITNFHDAVDFQFDYVGGLIDEVGYDEKLKNTKEVFHSWLRDRDENIATFRDKCYASVFTGTMAIQLSPWLQRFGEELEDLTDHSS